MSAPSSAAGRVRWAVIPAAGRGTRMLPFTKSVPKELLPIVNIPTGQLVVEEAARAGCRDVALVLSEGKQAVLEHFSPDPDLESALDRKGDERGLEAVRHTSEIATVHEARQDEPLGLGHAVAQAEDLVGDESFAVLLPDDLIDERDALLESMLSVAAERGGVVLGLIEVPPEQTARYGCVALEGEQPAPGVGGVVRVTDLVEKPDPSVAPSNLAVIGRYVLPGAVFDALRRTQPGAGGEIQLTDAMKLLLDDGVPVHGVVFTGRRYDTGAPLDYLAAMVQLGVQDPSVGQEFGAWLREFVAGGAST